MGLPVAQEFALIVDTTICGLRLALQPLYPAGEPSHSCWRDGLNEAHGSAAVLASHLRAGLASCGIDADSISRILVSRGPGSFTGIRVGLSFAQGFFAGQDKHPEGCSSLALYATAEATRRGRDVDVYLPATQASGYVARASKDGKTTLEPFAIEELERTSVIESRSVVSLVTGNWVSLVNAFTATGAPRVEVVSLPSVADAACLEMCREVVRVGGVRHPFGATEDMSPVYLRRSSVEEKMRGNR